MKHRSGIASVIIGAAFVLGSVARAQEQHLVHADEPLWAPGSDNVWPKHFISKNEFGCIHPIGLGDWKFTPQDGDVDFETWYRITNYGVFHCWMNVSEGSDPESQSHSRPSFLIRISEGGPMELWVMQIGAVPGSNYLLLSRPPEGGLISQFNVLQHQCHRSQTRGGPSLDILKTRYCISTRKELIALARRMASLPPRGTLVLQNSEPGAK